MAKDSLKRLDRIVAILIQLQSKRIITADEMADRFDVSVRTIYRDIRSLEAAGVPLYSEAGIGYSLLEGYRLPPVRFTQEEITSFVAAEKLVHHYMDKQLSHQFSAVMDKLKALLRWSEKDWISGLEPQVLIKSRNTIFNKNVPQAMSVFMEGIAGKKQVHLHYQAVNDSGKTHRDIEPVGIFQENGFWYLMAYCHLRKDYRQFRTDRLQQVFLLDKPFTKEHPGLSHLLEQKSERPTIQVRIRLDAGVARYLNYDKAYYGFESETPAGDKVEWVFNTSAPLAVFARWFLMFADKAQIISPQSLKDKVREILESAAKNV